MQRSSRNDVKYGGEANPFVAHQAGDRYWIT
jgi:hypothetical protein